MRRGTFASVLGVAFALGLAPAAPAAVTNLTLVERTGSSASTSPRSVSAPCPDGRQVLGSAGGKSFTAAGQVRSLEVRPNAALTAVVSTWREDQTGFADTWEPYAYALCADPLIGAERITTTSASDSAAKSAVATCPAGKKIIGLGGHTSGGASQVLIDAMRPAAALTSVTVVAREDRDGFSGNWTVSASAVCAKPPQGLQRVSAARAAADTFTDVGADCPTGKGLLGTGGEITTGRGRVSLETYVAPPAAGAPPTSTYARGWQDETGNYFNWSVTSYAICADVAVRKVTESNFNSTSFKNADFECPAGMRASSVGAEITGGLGQVHLVEVRPEGTGIEWWSSGSEDPDGFSGSWSQRGFGICITGPPDFEMISSTVGAGQGSATAQCPPGKRVIGAGGTLASDALGNDVHLASVVPNAALTRVTVDAGIRPGPATNGEGLTIRADAVCASPPPGLQRIAVAAPERVSDPASITASCPAGKHLVGLGGEIQDGFGAVVMDDLRPDAALRNVTVTGLEDQMGWDFSWVPAAYAICASI